MFFQRDGHINVKGSKGKLSRVIDEGQPTRWIYIMGYTPVSGTSAVCSMYEDLSGQGRYRFRREKLTLDNTDMV